MNQSAKKEAALTSERLKELLDYDPETGVFTRKPGKGVQGGGGTAGCPHCNGYWMISVEGKAYLAHRLAWLYTSGHWPKDQLDHINGVRDDNRLVNLRESSSAGNGQNHGLSKASTTGVTGVHWDKSRGKWLAHITVGWRTKHLGRFNTLEEAASARVEAKKRLHTFHPEDPQRIGYSEGGSL